MGTKSKCRKKIHNLINKYNALSMIEFLVYYANINSQLDVLKKATHKDIKLFNFDNVIGVSFNDVDCFKISNGEILLVYDSKHQLGAYKNPIRLEKKNKCKKLERGGYND